MFRNGFNATRRSLLTMAHSRPLPIPKRDGSFVCVACQFRSLHMKAPRKGKGGKSETFLDSIKKLEAHVQRIERNYMDKVRQQEALKVSLPSLLWLSKTLASADTGVVIIATTRP